MTSVLMLILGLALGIFAGALAGKAYGSQVERGQRISCQNP